MPESSGVPAARAVLAGAIAEHIFPAAVAEVGDSRGVLWREAFGTLTFDSPTRTSEDTLFDLASLTKPLATTALCFQLESKGALRLHEPVAAFFEDWRGDDRESVTVGDLLLHASGLAARLVDPPPQGRREFEHDICSMKLEYEPRTRSVYSDLGFILLGFIVADRAGVPLDPQFTSLAGEVATGTIGFDIADAVRSRTAPTLPMDSDQRHGRTLVGEVHDNYAHLLGGAAGHAGLFGTAAGVGGLARAALRGARGDGAVPPPFSPATMARASAPGNVPGSSRAFGWDTMLPTSSCGTLMSPTAFGHVGFTGTSVWIDPVRDRYFVLLTNRACGGGTLDDMRTVRRAFHDAVNSL